MARLRERIFAGFGAGLFLISACALTVFVIVQANSNSSTPTSTASTTCTATSIGSTALTLPSAYKPAGAASALESTDLTNGTGATAKSGDCLQVKYYGTLASDGTVFDENFDKTTAFQFQLGQGQVIQGWDKGVSGMKVGGTRRLVIPAALGYGATAQSGIPANSDLVFVVKLLNIQK